MMTIGIVMIIIGMIKDDEDDDNLGDGHDCHGKKMRLIKLSERFQRSKTSG